MFNKNVVGLCNLYNAPSFGEFTAERAPASCSFLGRYALIDMALSNFVNSGIDVVGIMVKEKIISVLGHCSNLQTWNENTKIGKETIMFNENPPKPSENTDIACMLANPWVFFDKKVDYVVIQPSHIITNINLKPIVKDHIKSGRDITVVYTHINDGDKSFINESEVILKKGSLRFKKNNGANKDIDVSIQTYVISRDVLVNLINSSVENKTMTLSKLFENAIRKDKVSVNTYEYKGYCRCFDSLSHYLEYSLELLDYDVAMSFFKPDWPYYTITHDTPPAKYCKHADVKNSFIANGCVIDGKIKNSVISRNCIIKPGAIITNSVILSNTVVEGGAILDNVVIDKHAYVSAEKVVKATKEQPFYLGKGKRI